MTTFNIGSQNAGSIQNVGGDMVVRGGIRGTATVHLVELQGRLADLRQEIDRVALPAESRAVAMQALAEAEAEAAAPAPRPSRIAQSLRRVTETLEDAGVLASAAVGAVRALGSALSLVPLLV
jgi:chorismate mutase